MLLRHDMRGIVPLLLNCVKRFEIDFVLTHNLYSFIS